MVMPHQDVLIIGAGLAGVGTACRISQECPDKSLALLERRERLGGTWDLFRYPGVRSDTDMYNYGFEMRPWHSPKPLGDGATIRHYIADAARDHGIDEKIHYGLKVVSADWSGQEQRWKLTAVHESSGETLQFSCGFLVFCTGYYDHEAGYLPDFPGQERFKGLRIHPQHWPEGLDYSGKKVIVIGSGATAITLVPAMADQAAHVTMLQRTPTYIVSLPGNDTLFAAMARVLPQSLVYRWTRKRYLAMQRAFYLSCRRWPRLMRGILLSQVRKHVGKGFDMKHFAPDYMPWDQRVCVVPDADLFEKIKSGSASVVTGRIETFTETGVRLESGQELPADLIVTATGLNLQVLGGIAVSVEGEARELGGLMTYKGVLVQNLPNLAWVFGGGNAPWTRRVELAATYLCRLLKHMQANEQSVVVPQDDDDSITQDSILGLLQSGYVQRGNAALPRQGNKYPWQISHHFGKDRRMLLQHPIEDKCLRFSGRPATVARDEHVEAH